MKKYTFALLIVISIIPFISAQTQTVGLFLNDSVTTDGYVLFTPKLYSNTYLIDNDGLLVHEWNTDYNPAASVYLLEDGNLLRATKLVDTTGSGGFQVLDWNSNVVWEYIAGSQHHDIEPLPNGNVLLILNDNITYDESIALGRDPILLDNWLSSLNISEIAFTDTGSTVVWEWSARDHFIQDYDQTKENYGVVDDHPGLINLNFSANNANNFIHPNSIDYNQDFDQILVSCRAFNEIWVIDHSTTTEEATTHSGGNSGVGGDLLYRWGNPRSYGAGDVGNQMLFGQHDARWIDNDLPGEGNIMIFNNGFGRDSAYSTIDEIIPPVDTLGNYYKDSTLAFGPLERYWFYKAENPLDFYSSKFSGAHRLANGNTMICEGVGGTFFEITQNGEMLWKYINPIRSTGPVNQGDVITQNDVYRIHKYVPDYPGLAGHDLIPIGPIETYLGIQNDEITVPTDLTLNQNYPNPFNPSTLISFYASTESKIEINIFDLQGKHIRTLFNEQVNPGNYSTSWSGIDEKGNVVSAGIYFYQIDNGTFSTSKKMILMK